MLGIAEFGCLKSGGFDLELTHITESEHLTEMIFFRTYAGKLRNPVSRRYLCVKTMIYCRNSVSLRKS